MAFVEDLPDWGEGWLADEGIAPGTPFLLSPVFEYDVDLNAYFTEELATSAPKTQEASARDLAAFLTFLWRSRGGRSWRDATEDDHRAYLNWRRRDPRGPRGLWDNFGFSEVATVNKFYWWALKVGYLAAHPIPQRMRLVSGPAGIERCLRTRRTSSGHLLPRWGFRTRRLAASGGLPAVEGYRDPRFRSRRSAD